MTDLNSHKIITNMKFIPILFSTPMVQAILQDCKTMTRRVMKPQPTQDDIDHIKDWNMPLSKYQVGNVLWVRETHFAFGEWKKNGTTKTGKQKWKFVRQKSIPVRFIDNKPEALESSKFRGLGWYKRSSLFLEKMDCRTFLEITNIRVERLNDISEEDSMAEGVVDYQDGTFKNYFKQKGFTDDDGVECLSAKASFISLWSSINGINSWQANPFVWVVEFKRIPKPENFN